MKSKDLLVGKCRPKVTNNNIFQTLLGWSGDMTPPSLPYQHEAIASRRWGRTYHYISLIALRSLAQVTHHDPPVGTLCGHKNGHISTNLRRQKLLIGASESS